MKTPTKQECFFLFRDSCFVSKDSCFVSKGGWSQRRANVAIGRRELRCWRIVIRRCASRAHRVDVMVHARSAERRHVVSTAVRLGVRFLHCAVRFGLVRALHCHTCVCIVGGIASAPHKPNHECRQRNQQHQSTDGGANCDCHRVVIVTHGHRYVCIARVGLRRGGGQRTRL
jgi:hypothetical protein